jgi:hypothetical protein
MTCTATTCTTKGLTVAAKIAALGKGSAPTTPSTFGGDMSGRL